MGGSSHKMRKDTPNPNQPMTGSGAPVAQYNPQFGNTFGYRMNQSQNPDVALQASRGITDAMGATAQASGFQQAPIETRVLADMNLSPYENKYQDQVINQTIDDMARANKIAGNIQDTRFGQAGAYGGSRHGIADAEMQRNFLDRVGATVGNLRSQGFDRATNLATGDLNRMYQTDAYNIGLGERAQDRAMQGAQQYANLGRQGFDMGQTVLKNMQQQGNVEQLINQNLFDSAKQQFGGYSGMPAETLGYLSQALGATTVPTTTQNRKDIGLFDYLSLGMDLMG
tara:strand:+ start:3956 stop:4807 length:852 start_codon:yes stop_codon:yes gene_type:complete